jgi:hypothetical protein
MSTRRRTFGAFLTLVLVSGACSPGEPNEPNPADQGPAASRLVSIRGTVREHGDSTTPVAGARLVIRQITAADEQDIPVASAYSNDAGQYGLSFRATCGTSYALQSDHPHYAIRASASIGPLPLENCASDELTIDLWVQ